MIAPGMVFRRGRLSITILDVGEEIFFYSRVDRQKFEIDYRRLSIYTHDVASWKMSGWDRVA